MSLLALLGTLYLLSFLLLMSFLGVSPSPTSALLFFWGLVILSCLMLYKSLTDLMPYLQFLVYMGGLLVLLIYMIMLSGNPVLSLNSSSVVFMVIVSLWITLLVTYPPRGRGEKSGLLLEIDFSSLILMGLLLTFVFLGICQVITIGGRSMNIGKNS